jgi:hypothetical protein
MAREKTKVGAQILSVVVLLMPVVLEYTKSSESAL